VSKRQSRRLRTPPLEPLYSPSSLAQTSSFSSPRSDLVHWLRDHAGDVQRSSSDWPRRFWRFNQFWPVCWRFQKRLEVDHHFRILVCHHCHLLLPGFVACLTRLYAVAPGLEVFPVERTAGLRLADLLVADPHLYIGIASDD